MKNFSESLKDGFVHIKEVSDPEQLDKLRQEGVLVDDEGYYSFSFGEHKEYELAVEPLLEDEGGEVMYQIALYKNKVRLTEKLPIWIPKSR